MHEGCVGTSSHGTKMRLRQNKDASETEQMSLRRNKDASEFMSDGIMTEHAKQTLSDSNNLKV